jgi:hypothetical protein
MMSFTVHTPSENALAAWLRPREYTLMLSCGFTVRSGIDVWVTDGGNCVVVTVKMDSNRYPTPPQPQKRPYTLWLPPVLDWINEVHPDPQDGEVLGADSRQAELIKAALEDAMNQAKLLPLNVSHFKDVINKGILMDVYQAPLPRSLHDDDNAIYDVPVAGMEVMSPVTVDDSQPFPIYGWMLLRWVKKQ